MGKLPTGGRVLITGASSGIGAAYATHFAQLGYSLCLVARRADRLGQLAEQLKARFGADAEIQIADLGAEKGLSEVEARLSQGDVVGLVNNAGAGGLGPLSSSTADALESNIRLNIVALARLSRAALGEFRRKNAGFLVNIGSVLAFAPSPSAAAYSGSKAFVLNFTRSLQLEFAASSVLIQLVMPGPVRTEFFSSQGMDGSVFPDTSYVSADDLVAAAVGGLRAGELVTVPSVLDLEIWENMESLRKEFMSKTLSGKIANRYQHGTPT